MTSRARSTLEAKARPCESPKTRAAALPFGGARRDFGPFLHSSTVELGSGEACRWRPESGGGARGAMAAKRDICACRLAGATDEAATRDGKPGADLQGAWHVDERPTAPRS